MISLICFYILTFVLFLTAGFITIPLISKWAKRYGFQAMPNGRTSHHHPRTNIAGLSFYLVLPFLFLISVVFDITLFSSGIFISPIILLILGLMDDKGLLNTRHKIIIQLLAITIFVTTTGLHLEGIYGLSAINEQFGFPLTILVIFCIMNAFNLIDGIDGLAGMISMISFLGAIYIFHIYGKFIYSILLSGLTGSILAFLYYNISNRWKVMMGDTGSLLLGFLLGILTIGIYGINPAADYSDKLMISQMAIVSVVLYPLMDMIRVFFIRIIQGISPFRADRRHFHHILLDHFHLNHLSASLIILGIHSTIIISTLLIMAFLSFWMFILYYLSILIIFILVVFLIRLKFPVRSTLKISKTQVA